MIHLIIRLPLYALGAIYCAAFWYWKVKEAAALARAMGDLLGL